MRDVRRGFTGLDLRQLTQAADPKSARKATNLDLTIAGGYKSRDPFVPFATVSANSVGLYSLGGFLRAVVPSGRSLDPPAGIVYDAVGDGTAYALGSIDSVSAVESIGQSATSGLFPYLVIKRTTGVYEHHWIRTPVYPSSVTANTRVALPFDPGAALIKIASKLWATDIYNNAVRFSSVTNGPTDWTLENDAGTLNIANAVTGDRKIYGLGYVNGELAVFLADAVQLWRVFADPTRVDFGIDRVINGPGTEAPRSIQNVLGDVFYFSRGGFRSLRQNSLTGQYREGDVGGKIQLLTKDIDPTASGTRPIALWSQARQQYICAIGATVYVYTWSKVNDSEVMGWTTWTAPAAVEYMTENDGELYFRAGNVIYKATPGAATTLEPGYAWDYRSQFSDQSDPHVNKEYDYLEVVQSGTSNISFYDDPSNPDTAAGDTTLPLVGPTAPDCYVPINMLSQYMSLGFSGTINWKLEQYEIRYDLTGL